MIRILFIAAWGDIVGGGPISLLNLVRNLDRGKFVPIVICPSYGSLVDAFKKINVKVEIIKTKPLKGLHLFSFISAVIKLVELIKKEEINIIHSNVGASRESLCGAISAKMTGNPFIYHARVLESSKLLERFLTKCSAKIITNSDAVKRKFLWVKDEKKIVRIYNGINLEEFNPSIDGKEIKKEFQIDENQPIVGMVANLIPWKGHKYFLEAARSVIDVGHSISTIPDTKFLIVGEDLSKDKKHEKQLMRLVEDSELNEKVIFTGFRKDIPQILASLDIFVLSSIDEPFGRVIIEAMAMEKPVIATNSGGIPEIVKDGETGILVPPKNSKAIAKAIITLLKNKKLKKDMEKKGRRKVERFFSIEKNVKETEELYKNLLRSSVHVNREKMKLLIRPIYILCRLLIFRTVACLFINKEKKQIFENRIRKILIIRIDRIGDFVLSSPAIRALRKKFPQAHIAIMVNPKTKDLAEDFPYIDEVITYDGKDKLKFIRELRKKKFDLAIDFILDYKIKSALLTYLSGASYKIGFDIEGRGVFFNVKVVPDRRIKHQIEYTLDLVKAIGIEMHNKEPEILVSDKADKYIEDYLDKKGVGNDDLLVGIHPGGHFPSQLWMKERFAQLANEIMKKHKTKIVIIGGPSEEELVREVVNLTDDKAIGIDSLPLKNLAALIQRCNLFICNNSGPLHIAVAVKTPTVSTMGPTVPHLWWPWGDGHIVIRKNLPCSPCNFAKCKKHFCMKLISAQDMMEAVEIQFRKTR